MRALLLLGAGAAALLACGCSPARLAANALGGAMAGSGSVYARDDDPELVAAALPFGLKTTESLLETSPENRNLLLAAASGFTQYSHAFVAAEADYVEESDPERARELRARALKLYRRALDYGLRGLDVGRAGWQDKLRSDPAAAVAALRAADVPLLYWTAAAWGSAIGLAVGDPEWTADLSTVGLLLERAAALEPGFAQGALWDAFIVYDGGRPAAAGGSVDRASAHLARALELSGGKRAGPYVAFAESVSVGRQDRAEFERLLGEALAIDPDAAPDQRLANLIAQKRARWLLSRTDRLFLE